MVSNCFDLVQITKYKKFAIIVIIILCLNVPENLIFNVTNKLLIKKNLGLICKISVYNFSSKI